MLRIYLFLCVVSQADDVLDKNARTNKLSTEFCLTKIQEKYPMQY